MRIRGIFTPKPVITDREAASGLRWLTWDGMTSQGFSSITTSGFLAAFALILGANNLQIGILAAIPFLTQPLQIAVIPLVERIRRRKLIAVAAWLPAQLLWVPIALIPVFLHVPSAGAVSLLLGLLAFRGVLHAICNCAWNSWIRDLVPQQILGRFFARRQALAGLVAMAFGLAAAFFADYWKGHSSADSLAIGYTIPLLIGVLTLGLASPLFMTLMPEPLMQPTREPQPSLLSSITTPFRDKNYRYLLRFLFLWGLAINLATPFFAVYMIQRLELPLSLVIGLSVLSQAANVMFLRVWGGLADRVGMKAILSVCVSLYILVVLGWVFTTMPDRYFLSIPLLVVLHILAGVAAAGVSLAIATIGLKLAPEDQATSYLSGTALTFNLGSGLGPLLGGLFADFFSVREFSIRLTWIDPSRTVELKALSLTSFDFLFGIAFILGLMTLPLLAALREEGEGGNEVVLESLYAPMRYLSRPMSTIPALNFISQFPFSYIRKVPVPGLDAAMGVTAYQLAAMTRGATVSAAKGKKATERIVKPLEEAISEIWNVPKGIGQHSVGVVREAARGAIHAIDEVTMDIGYLSHDVVMAVTRSFRHSSVKSEEVIKEASYGVVRGAGETFSDVGEAALQAVEAAKKAARESGITADLAATQAVKGAMEAAGTLGQEAEDRIREALPDKLLEEYDEALQKSRISKNEDLDSLDNLI